MATISRISEISFPALLFHSTIIHKMITTNFRRLSHALQELSLFDYSCAAVFASPEFVTSLTGGSAALLAALSQKELSLLCPAFTPQTLLVPEVGPVENGVVYGSATQANADAQFFSPALEAENDPFANFLRQHPGSQASQHPLWRFVALGGQAQPALAQQNLSTPFAPLYWLARQGAALLLLGTSLGQTPLSWLAAERAGAKSCVRWALLPEKIVEIPHSPCETTLALPTIESYSGVRYLQLGQHTCAVLNLCSALLQTEDYLRAVPNQPA